MGIFAERDICPQRLMGDHEAFRLEHNVPLTIIAAVYCDCAVKIDGVPINDTAHCIDHVEMQPAL